jgi:hypothetical protein
MIFVHSGWVHSLSLGVVELRLFFNDELSTQARQYIFNASKTL